MAVSDSSHNSARRRSYQQGLKDGYLVGLSTGSQQYGSLFEGTSIIIPSRNQLKLLQKCLASIEKFTEPPYEILVVDNASVDGTGEYLESLGGLVRFRVLEQNLGYAGAVNRGLMMAKGRTIVLLHSDTLVADKWLRNLLYCLNSDPAVGMVGPVTHKISGEQRIRVPYGKLEDMPAFAHKHNHRRPAMWRETQRLRAFCLLFRREFFEDIGYWDEGFETDDFAEDDYNIRARLSGKRLVIAGDTYIHHYDSDNMSESGETLANLDADADAYNAKWNSPPGWMKGVVEVEHQQGYVDNEARWYPERIAVRGTGEGVYWIENGVRRPVQGSVSFPVVRVSNLDLWRWPIGEPIAADLTERPWRGLDDISGWAAGVAVLPDGRNYHVEGNTVRRIVSIAALHAWMLHWKPARLSAFEDLAGRINGLPIIAPPVMKQTL